MQVKAYPSVTKRREALEQGLEVTLEKIGNHSIDEERAAQKNCENMIGATQIPLGIAGPLLVQGDYAQSEFYLPLATTEGALVASISRGCKAITLSGGAQVSAFVAGQTRGPVFTVTSLRHGRKVAAWIGSHEKELAKIAEHSSTHLKYKKSLVRLTGRYVFVRFSFDTKDAMGMNMVTIATEAIASEIVKETQAQLLSVAGNFDIDKKAAWLNVIENRGFALGAEVILAKETVSSVLKTTPQQFFDVWLAKCMIGSAMSGAMGFNAHFANVIAALFISTGQDPAHVVEGSLGITTAQVLPTGELYVSIYLPALLVGTVGGGTMLGTQREALALLQCIKEGSSIKLAEIIGAAVLAGEISLLASLSEGSLGTAHSNYARGGKK